MLLSSAVLRSTAVPLCSDVPPSSDVPRSSAMPNGPSRLCCLRLATLAALAVGLVARILPLFDIGGRLLRQFPTEDGYLMLTIARNLALGKGFAVADGTIATNGTQPLATFLYASAFWLTGGERSAGVGIVLALQVVLGLG